MVWKAIRKTKSKGDSNSINHLKANGKLITNKKQVAEAIATNLSKYSLTDNRYVFFWLKKKRKKKTPRLLF